MTGLTRAELAEVYRRAAVVLVPSEAEGFGLPVIEALACGAAVVASDIPALREAGGPAAVYAPVGDVGAWADAVAKVLADPAAAPPGPSGWPGRAVSPGRPTPRPSPRRTTQLLEKLKEVASRGQWPRVWGCRMSDVVVTCAMSFEMRTGN